MGLRGIVKLLEKTGELALTTTSAPRFQQPLVNMIQMASRWGTARCPAGLPLVRDGAVHLSPAGYHDLAGTVCNAMVFLGGFYSSSTASSDGNRSGDSAAGLGGDKADRSEEKPERQTRSQTSRMAAGEDGAGQTWPFRPAPQM